MKPSCSYSRWIAWVPFGVLSACTSDWAGLRRGRADASAVADAMMDSSTTDIARPDVVEPPADGGDAATVDGGTGARRVVAGDNFTCVYTVGTRDVRCLGDDTDGEFALGTFALRAAPTALTGLPAGAMIVQMAAASRSLCALVEQSGSRAVYCAGSRTDSQVGDGTPGASPIAEFTRVRGLPEGDVAEIAGAGTTHCAITTSERALYCWGRMEYRLPRWTVATRLVGAAGAAVSGIDTVWIGRTVLFAKRGTTILGFGVRDSGMLIDTGTGPIVSELTPAPFMFGGVSSGAANSGYVCAVLNGRVLCWGNGVGAWGGAISLPTDVGLDPMVRATTVALGERHGCALSDDGRVFCWGFNHSGQLGSSSVLPDGSMTPVRVALPANAASLVSGLNHTCALLVTGAVACWGSGAHGQLAHAVLAPVTDQARTTRQIAAGGHVTCTSDDARMQCFGENDRWAGMDYRAVGDKTVLQLPAGTITGLAISSQLFTSYGLCATTSVGALYCAGNPQSSFTSMGAPVALPQGVADGDAGRRALAVRNVALGNNFVLAVDAASSAIYGWGEGRAGCFGAAGVATIPYGISLPDSAMTMEALDPIDAGVDFVCGRRSTSGALLCWGYDGNGQGARGTAMTEVISYMNVAPTTFAGLRVAAGRRAISVGVSHLCAIGRAGADTQDFTYCWGLNDGFQSGLSSANITTARRTGLPIDLVAVAAGAQHTCGITATGAVRCWGSNRFGELGTSVGGFVPPNEALTVTLPAGEVARDIDAGFRHTCVRTESNRAFCWGWRGYGQVQRGMEPLPRWLTAQVVAGL